MRPGLMNHSWVWVKPIPCRQFRPMTGFTVPIKEFRLNAGAGFVVAICGNMMTMPGLPKRPAALDMDMDENGNLIGVFG